MPQRNLKGCSAKEEEELFENHFCFCLQGESQVTQTHLCGRIASFIPRPTANGVTFVSRVPFCVSSTAMWRSSKRTCRQTAGSLGWLASHFALNMVTVIMAENFPVLSTHSLCHHPENRSTISFVRVCVFLCLVTASKLVCGNQHFGKIFHILLQDRNFAFYKDNIFCLFCMLHSAFNFVCLVPTPELHCQFLVSKYLLPEFLMILRLGIQGDSEGKVNILGGDCIGHCEKKVHRDTCIIVSGYRDTAV